MRHVYKCSAIDIKNLKSVIQTPGRAHFKRARPVAIDLANIDNIWRNEKKNILKNAY